MEQGIEFRLENLDDIKADDIELRVGKKEIFQNNKFLLNRQRERLLELILLICW